MTCCFGSHWFGLSVCAARPHGHSRRHGETGPQADEKLARLARGFGRLRAWLPRRSTRPIVARLRTLWLAGDGRLDANPKAILRQLYDGVIIDTLTGALTYHDGT